MSGVVTSFQRDESPEVEVDLARIDALANCVAEERVDALRLRCLGEQADLLRRVGRHQDAIDVARVAMELAVRIGDGAREAANVVRLATALQYGGRHDEARAMFAAALERTEPGFVAYHHLLLQHLGKCLVELGKRADAVVVLERALVLRRELGNAGYVESTRRALDAITD